MIDGHGDQRCHRLRPPNVRQGLDVVGPHAGHPLLADRRGQCRHRKRIGDLADLFDSRLGLPGIIEPLPQPFEPDRPLLLREVHAVGPLDQFDLLHRPPHATVSHEAAGRHQFLRARRFLSRGLGRSPCGRGGLVAHHRGGRAALQRRRHDEHRGDDSGMNSHGITC